MSIMLSCYFCYILYNEQVSYQMIDSLNKKVHDNVENVEYSIKKDSTYNNLLSMEITIESRDPDSIFEDMVEIISETNPIVIHFGHQEDSYSTGEENYMGLETLMPSNEFNDYIEDAIGDYFYRNKDIT